LDKTLIDQAEGLRKMLSGSRPRVYTFISTVSRNEKIGMLANLGTSLARADISVLLLDATLGSRGTASYLDISQVVTLLDVARREGELEHAIIQTRQGFAMATLARNSMRSTIRNRNQAARLKTVFESLAGQFDLVMVDAELDEGDEFLLPAISNSEIVIHVSESATSIKSAYTVIKRINSRDGRRAFSVLVTGATEQRAQIVYENMAKAARRYLAVELNSIGHVPMDEHLNKAARLGKSVVDAFPRAGASVAFRRLAGYFSCAEATL
jgi:flagellar biosynthesis protein FlhG